MTSLATTSLVLIVAALAAGCAASDTASVNAEPRAPREYRTGSNIPTREPRPTSDEERNRAQADLEEVRRAGGLSR